MARKLTEQEIIRREKVTYLQELGIDPFGQRFDRTHNTASYKEAFKACTKDELHDMESLGTPHHYQARAENDNRSPKKTQAGRFSSVTDNFYRAAG